MKIFNTTRIGFDELYNDAMSFIINQYNQSKQVFSLASPYGQLLTVMLSLGRMILFYIEDLITESNILTAQKDDSIRGIARLVGHNPTRAISAQGNIQLRYNGNEVDMYGNTIILPRNLKVKNIENGLSYILQFNNKDIRFELLPNNKIETNIIQGVLESQQTTGTNKKLQSVSFTVDPGVDIDNFNVDVYVNGEIWAQVPSIYDATYESKTCVVKTGLTSGIDIFFGTGHLGMKPPENSKITVEYIKTDGEKGNIRKDDKSTWVFMGDGYDLTGEPINLNNIFDITVNTDISFGANKESIEMTRILAPKTSRNYILANPTNYISFFEKFNFFSIVDAYTTYDDDNLLDDKTIYIFLVPDINKRLKSNENYFTVPISEFILKPSEYEKIYKLIDQSGQKMTHIVNKIVSPIISKYAININLTIFEGYQEDTIKQQITEILSEFFLNLRRRDRVPKSDLITLVEQIDGIDSISINFISEKNELSKKNNPDAELIGINSFGDMVFEKNELILIRGGWYDRYDRWIYDTTDIHNNSMINISIDDIITQTYNNIKHQQYLKTKKTSSNDKNF